MNTAYKKQAEHYICLGGCKGVSSIPGVCQAPDCKNHNHDLVPCYCTDGLHNNFEPSEEQFKEMLTPEQYRVLREKGTEAPFSGKFIHPDKDGIYRCVACGNALFNVGAKFESGTGWPSFDEALPGAVVTEKDNSLGMSRTEVLCARCGSHLGHLFNDGPTDTGKRYCINAVCFDDFE